jgi:uncharacterized membrane protein
MTEQSNIPPPPASTGFRFNGPTLISGLYLATYFTVFTALVGVILAYVWKRHTSEDWQRTHYSYLIRTFWLGICGYAIVGAGFAGFVWASQDEAPLTSSAMEVIAITGIVIGGLWVVALSILLVIRCAMSLVNAQQDAPMPRPQSWTF